LGMMDIRKNIRCLFKILLCSLPMGFAAYFICSLGSWTTTGNELEKVLLLVPAIVVGIGFYFVCSYLVKNEEMLFLLKMVRRKR